MCVHFIWMKTHNVTVSLPLTCPAGAAQQQRRSLRPQGHCVISEVTNREDGPLHVHVLRPFALELRMRVGQSHEQLVLQLQWRFSEDGGWSVVQSRRPANVKQSESFFVLFVFLLPLLTLYLTWWRQNRSYLMPQFFCKSSFIALVTQRLWVASGPKKCSYLEEDGNQKIYISIKVFCDPFCPNYKPRNYTAFKVQEVSDPTFTPRKSDLSYQRNIL